jgi:beta-propeller uncharacterized protein DUF5122
MASQGRFRSAARNCSLLLITLIAGCSGGSDNGTPPSTTTTTPSTTAQEPTKPPPTTQPSNSTPPSTEPPGSQPPGSGSGSGGGFAQGTGFNGFVRTIVMAQDGTHDLYVGGDFTTYNGTAANHLIRLHPDGSVARTFGAGFDQVVLNLALTTDGTNALYAAGPFSQFDGQPVPQLVRLTAGGLRDPTFQATALDFLPVTLAVTEDGSRDVYAGGNVEFIFPPPSPPGTAGRVARFNPDGSPDPTFPINTTIPPSSADNLGPEVVTIAVPPGSGKLYVSGNFKSYNGQDVWSFFRLNPDGTIDSTFASGTGVGLLDSGSSAVETLVGAADGSGDIYAGGHISQYNGTQVPFGSIRVHDNGVLDTSYAQAVQLVPMGMSPAQDGTGDILVSGFSVVEGLSTFRLLRVDRTGALVANFREPALHIEQDTPYWLVNVVPVLDGTRDLYIGGTFTTYNDVPVNHIARIHADGSLASVVN